MLGQASYFPAARTAGNRSGDLGVIDDDDVVVCDAFCGQLGRGMTVDGQLTKRCDAVPAQIAGVGAFSVQNDNFHRSSPYQNFFAARALTTMYQAKMQKPRKGST